MNSLKKFSFFILLLANYGCNTNQSIKDSSEKIDKIAADDSTDIDAERVTQSNAEVPKGISDKKGFFDFDTPKIVVDSILGIEVTTERHFKVDSELDYYLSVRIKNISDGIIIGAAFQWEESYNEREIGKYKFVLKPNAVRLLKISNTKFRLSESEILGNKPLFGKVAANKVFYSDGNITSKTTEIIIN